MPKKLTQLLNDVDAVVTSYDNHMGQLRGIVITASNHRGMIEEGEGELLHRIKELEQSGMKGATVGDFYGDTGARTFIDEIENQKARFLNACAQYWKVRAEIDQDLHSAEGVVATAKEFAADKKRQWSGSNSVQTIQAVTKELEAWCKNIKLQKKDLDTLPKPGTKKVAWMSPGAIKKMRRSDVMDRQGLHDLEQLLAFIQKRIVADPKRAATHKSIHDRLAGVAKVNPD